MSKYKFISCGEVKESDGSVLFTATVISETLIVSNLFLEVV